MSRTDLQRLREAVVHLDAIDAHLARGDLDDQTIADAACLRLAAAIEAVSGIDTDIRTATFGPDWALIWATRNRIAHGYAFIDRNLIEATIAEDVPQFEASVRLLLDTAFGS